MMTRPQPSPLFGVGLNASLADPSKLLNPPPVQLSREEKAAKMTSSVMVTYRVSVIVSPDGRKYSSDQK